MRTYALYGRNKLILAIFGSIGVTLVVVDAVSNNKPSIRVVKRQVYLLTILYLDARSIGFMCPESRKDHASDKTPYQSDSFDKHF